jgi:hypothetical protein
MYVKKFPNNNAVLLFLLFFSYRNDKRRANQAVGLESTFRNIADFGNDNLQWIK